MSRHRALVPRLSRADVSRLLALCLVFVAVDQVNDPLLSPSLSQQVGYWLARVAALAVGLFVAAVLIEKISGERWTKPAWIRPLLFVTALGILPLVTVEVFLEPRLPIRPEFADDELRAFSPALAFVAEYFTLATILFPAHVLLWLLIPGRPTARNGADSHSPSDEIQTASPEFIKRAQISSAGSVIALKAEEHYVKVYTPTSEHLVLHRFSAAAKEMPAELGLQVHRSWWIADDAVVRAKRGDRRWQLILSNELSVPVSDSYIRSVRERGLLVHRTSGQ